MLKTISAWRRKRRSRRSYQPVGVLDEQLMADLGLTWEDLCKARADGAESTNEGAVFP